MAFSTFRSTLAAPFRVGWRFLEENEDWGITVPLRAMLVGVLAVMGVAVILFTVLTLVRS